MSRPKPPGSINAHGLATIFGADGRALAVCFDTPNSIACAFVMFPDAATVRSGWPMHIEARRADYADRFQMAFADAVKRSVRPL